MLAKANYKHELQHIQNASSLFQFMQNWRTILGIKQPRKIVDRRFKLYGEYKFMKKIPTQPKKIIENLSKHVRLASFNYFRSILKAIS